MDATSAVPPPTVEDMRRDLAADWMAGDYEGFCAAIRRAYHAEAQVVRLAAQLAEVLGEPALAVGRHGGGG